MSVVHDVVEVMRACPVLGQEGEDARYAARCRLQREGISSFVDQGPPLIYYFTLPVSRTIVIVGSDELPCPDCTGYRLLDPFEVCRTCWGKKKTYPKTKVPITGFMLDPAQDWKTVGYLGERRT